ncbi:hypothetical protein IMCC3317_18020 [Kordia antarctica]|uniref:Uncharacterized protein n=1 Tax=Kordia antarctica TaxID=1218801 RepID=A0A7L4ZJ41_9FLAO|nr:hypothetical protein [Kordia antarctica]QHI36439.1 hypothetical protein IMCC3317_18020 [Kordia antarctica]
MSFFLYIYAVKIQNTILLFFIFTFTLQANTTVETNRTKKNINATVIATDQGTNTSSLVAPTIANDAEGGGITADKGSLNSILGYSILIFFSVLIIILIDNRNLERRYKKLASDFNNKEPIL